MSGWQVWENYEQEPEADDEADSTTAANGDASPAEVLPVTVTEVRDAANFYVQVWHTSTVDQCCAVVLLSVISGR